MLPVASAVAVSMSRAKENIELTFSKLQNILLPVSSGVAVSISRAKDNIELTLGKLQKILVKKGIESFSISKLVHKIGRAHV